MKAPKQIELPTSLGNAVAVKDSQGAAWEIGYPWGGDRFYGSASEVRARMKRAIRVYEAEAVDDEKTE